jgi:DNA-binding NtrC family response regulator
MELQPTALVAMSGQGCRSSLVEHLKSARLEVHLVESCREARAFLGNHPTVDLVLTEVSLPDGNWSDILRYVVDHAEQASILVTCSNADEQFWSEVLWRGVYDLLLEPCDAYQVRRTVEGAIRHARRASPRPLGSSRTDAASMSADANVRLLARAAS